MGGILLADLLAVCYHSNDNGERRAASGERRKSGHTPMIPNAKPMAVAAAFIFVIER